MLTKEQKRIILENIVDLLELPPSAYETAKNRYDDLGEWFGRENSQLKDYDPHVFPQGSFRLGTAIKPLEEHESYDLDLACELKEGITKDSSTQEDLKILIGEEVESYRTARNIKAPKEEKRRCWRLEYQDELSFHMDIVPCIPADESKRVEIRKSMITLGEGENLSEHVSNLTVSITDNDHDRYRIICDNWNISNPEGYAKWFESRMALATDSSLIEKAQVVDLPIYKKKTPLQCSIQLLKRHRDQMFKDDDDLKPISVIITTLASKAYNGESDVESALSTILERMGTFVNSTIPKVSNPVNPAEDFADKWYKPDHVNLNLETNFWAWLFQAQTYFAKVTSTQDVTVITEQVQKGLSVNLDVITFREKLGIAFPNISTTSPKKHSIVESESPRPWVECGK